jgi:molecular chaperone DnaJ
LSASADNDNQFYHNMTPYEILGVPSDADKKVIKSAYRKLVGTWHPDKFQDVEQKKEGNLRMEKINHAYYLVGDDDRRQRFDRFGEQGVGTSAASEEQLKKQGGPNPFAGFGGSAEGGVNIGDLFESLFAGSGASGVSGFEGFGGFAGGKSRRNPNAPVPGRSL